MRKYEKIVVGEKTMYREFCLSTGYYIGSYSEEELMNRLMEESIHSVTKIDEQKIECALDSLGEEEKKVLETYICYLERVVESLERPLVESSYAHTNIRPFPGRVM